MTQKIDLLTAFHDFAPEPEDFLSALVAGLSAPHKSMPCKFFYDKRGSALFDQICELPEYYVTRTENALLRDVSGEIAELAGSGAHLIEFGSGSSRKIRTLLDSLKHPAAYTAIDISRQHLLDSTQAVATDYPSVAVSAVCADYTKPIELPGLETALERRPLAFFPGSSIGNFSRPDAREFLSNIAYMLRPTGGDLLIGIDLKKDVGLLEAAYNDTAGVTADFNLNLLVRANSELGANFDLAGFRHQAIYNAEDGRIEMYLFSTRAQQVTIGGLDFRFADGEAVHTENSYKYTVEEVHTLAKSAGFEPSASWTDPDQLFSIHYLRLE
ncbi:MAG: L-histidine N(alpha)-methyltransferase [Alphaproteobacteria bacterium]